ncbi:MAG: hypothetical protein EXQ74_04045 [Thermoleophilia bacterium]|nr:hypothetical protein [Thermoleophilia bacterium]
MSTDTPQAQDPNEPEVGDDEKREPTREEMVAAEMMRRLMTTPVQDVVMQSMATFTDMAAIRLGLGPRGEDDFDLPQAGLAIESLRALLAVTNAIMGEEAAAPFTEPLAQLQLAFADLIDQIKAAREGEGGDGTSPAGGTGGEIWTPGGDRPGGGGLWKPGESK